MPIGADSSRYVTERASHTGTFRDAKKRASQQWFGEPLGGRAEVQEGARA